MWTFSSGNVTYLPPTSTVSLMGNPKTRKPETGIRNPESEPETGNRNSEFGIRNPQIKENKFLKFAKII